MSDLTKYFGSRRETAAIDSATAWKVYQVALASLDEGAATTAVEKAYQDALAQVTRNSRVAYANLTYTESVAQIGSVGDAITDMGQAGKTYITNLAGDEKAYTDTAAPIIGARTLLYTQADNNLRKAITTADNVWRNNTAQAWGTHTAGDLVARGAVRRTLANTSSLLADASHASIAELKAQWWQNEIPNYLQWSVDIGGIETAYTNSTTSNILLRATGIKTAGVAYASTVGTAIQAFETTTATAREQYLSTLMTVSETAAEATLRADRDKEIALADADLQKQLTGNESAHTTAVNNANSAHSTATANAQAAYSTSRANAQAAHDAAMLDAMEDWQLSSRESLTDLLFTEGQSRETYNVAASNVYANWENRVGNLLGDKPEGTGYVPVRGFGDGGVGTVGGVPAITTTRFQEGDDETLDSEVESEDDGTPRPIPPPSEGPIVWLTQQQMLDLERQHGVETMNRLRSSYRIRDPNIGFLPGDLTNSLPRNPIAEAAINQTPPNFGLDIPYSAINKEPLTKLTLKEWTAYAAPDLPTDYAKVKSVGCLGVVQAYAGKIQFFGAPTRMFYVKDRPDLSLRMAIRAARELKDKGSTNILVFANHYYDSGTNPPESLGYSIFEVKPRIHSGTKIVSSPGFEFAAYDFDNDCWWGATEGGEEMMVVRWPEFETFAKSYPGSYNTTVVGVTLVGPGTAFHPEKYENFWQDYWNAFQQNFGL